MSSNRSDVIGCGLLALALLVGSHLAPSAQAMDRFSDMTAVIRADPSGKQPALDLEIEFALDSARLSARALRRLDRIAAVLRLSSLAAARLQIAGHSDSSGPSDYNRRLSERRAAEVKTYLVDRQGLSPSRLETAAWGEERPKHRLDPRGPSNRRVEIAVLTPIESLLKPVNEATVETPTMAGDRKQIKIEW